MTEPTLAEVAGGTAHALNNVLGMLAAAADHLAGSGDPQSLHDARSAVEAAQARLHAASAAMVVLALGAGELARLGCGPARPLATRTWLPRANHALQQAAGVVPLAGSGTAPALHWPLDGESVCCVLVCAATVLRRDHGDAAALRWALYPPSDARSRPGSWLLELTAEALGAPQRARASSDHPCALALQHAAAVLPAAGIDLVYDGHGSARLRVPDRSPP